MNCFTTVTLVEEIRLPSKFLDADLKKHLFTCLKRKEHTCSKKYGYIQKIVSLDTIIDSQISMADSTNCFTVAYTFEIMKPEQNVWYCGIIVAIYSEGMIVDIDNLFQVLIVDGIYDSIKKTYTTIHPKTNERCDYKTADEIKVRVTDTTFRDGQFNCIGTPFAFER